MYYIVGLGNPGKKYENTRHNAGRIVLDGVMERLGMPEMVERGKWAGEVTEGHLAGHDVVFFYPSSYMNESGGPVKKLLLEHGEKLQSVGKRLIVVHDELDLPLGQYKVTAGGGAAGHNGLKSIHKALGTQDFTRIKIGVSPETNDHPLGFLGLGEKKLRRPQGGEQIVRHVLGSFSKKEIAVLEALVPDLTREI